MAVYTPLSESDIAAFLTRYNVGELVSFSGISEGVSNTNYLINVIPSVVEGSNGDKDPSTRKLLAQDDTKKYILTLFEKHYRLEDLPYFTAVMQWWRARGIVCPEPLSMKDGRVLSVLKEKPAILVSFLEGAGVNKITLDHVSQVGKLAAQMHIAGMDFAPTRENRLSLSGWEKLIDDIGPRADEIDEGLFRFICDEYNYLSEHWPSGLPSGPVHADLFPDNVFFTKVFGRAPELSGVIDFYFACHDFWAYDLAICINAWCFDERHRFVPERAQAMMAAYTDMRPLTPEEEAALPLLLRGAAMRFLLTRAYDTLNPEEGAQISLKDPMEYAVKLKFFQEGKFR
ncbi:MAG: homoserine kinase [Alphaproteobacteria bacterium]|nr:homoserine kinase [Alphaproteobacteria bacterium]